jgi:hypothetical protein
VLGHARQEEGPVTPISTGPRERSRGIFSNAYPDAPIARYPRESL